METQNVRVCRRQKNFVNNASRIIREYITKRIEVSIRTWDELLTFVDRKLKISKCEYFIINWYFNKNEILLAKINDIR